MKVCLQISGLLFPLSSLFLVTFPRNMAQVARKHKSTFVWKLFYGSLCIFEVMKYFVAEKEFFYYGLRYSVEYIKLRKSECCSLQFFA